MGNEDQAVATQGQGKRRRSDAADEEAEEYELNLTQQYSHYAGHNDAGGGSRRHSSDSQRSTQACPHQEEDYTYRVVLTGGPCAGKSTALSMLRDRLRNLGWTVVTAPENATLLFTSIGGFDAKWAEQEEKLSQMQAIFLRAQIAMEDNLLALAKMKGGKVVLLCDRGALDGRMFLEDRAWESALQQCGVTEAELRDQRYDMIVHMVTAANGAEEFYEWGPGSKNPERYHDLKEAVESCRRGQDSYKGHPYVRVIDNSTGFDRKVERVLENILSRLGEPVPHGRSKRVLVKSVADEAITIPFQAVDQWVQCLRTGQHGEERTLRKRGQGGTFTFAYRMVRYVRGEDGKRRQMSKTERHLSERDYEDMLRSETDAGSKQVHKRVRCFTYLNRYYELNEYMSSDTGLPRAELTLDCEVEQCEDMVIPPFIEVMQSRGKNFTSPQEKTRLP